eukprot:s890_g6.t1
MSSLLLWLTLASFAQLASEYQDSFQYHSTALLELVEGVSMVTGLWPEPLACDLVEPEMDCTVEPACFAGAVGLQSKDDLCVHCCTFDTYYFAASGTLSGYCIPAPLWARGFSGAAPLCSWWRVIVGGGAQYSSGHCCNLCFTNAVLEYAKTHAVMQGIFLTLREEESGYVLIAAPLRLMAELKELRMFSLLAMLIQVELSLMEQRFAALENAVEDLTEELRFLCVEVGRLRRRSSEGQASEGPGGRPSPGRFSTPPSSSEEQPCPSERCHPGGRALDAPAVSLVRPFGFLLLLRLDST